MMRTSILAGLLVSICPIATAQSTDSVFVEAEDIVDCRDFASRLGKFNTETVIRAQSLASTELKDTGDVGYLKGRTSVKIVFQEEPPILFSGMLKNNSDVTISNVYVDSGSLAEQVIHSDFVGFLRRLDRETELFTVRYSGNACIVSSL